jgi:hypothetical protein
VPERLLCRTAEDRFRPMISTLLPSPLGLGPDGVESGNVVGDDGLVIAADPTAT